MSQTTKKSIELTEAAVAHLVRQLTTRAKGLGIRIRLKKTGCAGFEYVVEYADIAEAGDCMFPITGTDYAVYVDPKTYEYVKGMIVDYGKIDLNEGLIFNNPNVANECGCGKSVRFGEHENDD